MTFVETLDSSNAARRFVHEQTTLPKLIRQSGAHVLISTGNFALWNSPVPQILLSRNSLYTSADFMRDIRTRGDYELWADTLVKGWFARCSIARADVTVAPSDAFAHDLSEWSGRKVLAIYHGFDAGTFTQDATPLAGEVRGRLDEGEGCLRLLFVSHYNYYRNFETLFRAVLVLKKRLRNAVKLYLTCRLNSAGNPGSYRVEAASSLVDDLRLRNNIVELGAIPHCSVHHLYRACHIYVTPTYTESFAHPLVEAMSSGLPVIASDLPVHREICRDAAIYFPRFSPEELAERVLQVHGSAELAGTLSLNGLERSRDFRWDTHVERLVSLAQELVDARRKPA